jgi:putative restriction endonuclease
MTNEEVIKKLTNFRYFVKNGERAPHKPLLLLLALAAFQNKKSTFLKYSEIEEQFKGLLELFGPPRKSFHPEHPFVRLSNDKGIWDLRGNIFINTKSDPSPKTLINNNFKGGFSKEIQEALIINPALIKTVAEVLLNEHFPTSIHEDILDAVGLDLGNSAIKRQRDSRFRERILIAYNFSCAICGYNVRLANKNVALDAAHIKWHNCGGPDIEQNGLALCSLHHKLFDLGVFTIDDDLKVLVSNYANGTHGLEENLLKFHYKNINLPQEKYQTPNDDYLQWHLKQVFKGEKRGELVL